MGCCCSSSEKDPDYMEPMLDPDDAETRPASSTRTSFTLKSQVVRKGFCTKQGSYRKNWNKRYFILSSGVLSYYKSSLPEYPYSSGYKGHVNLTFAKLTSFKDKQNRLTLELTNSNVDPADGKNFLLFRGETDEDSLEWASVINEAIYECATDPSTNLSSAAISMPNVASSPPPKSTPPPSAPSSYSSTTSNPNRLKTVSDDSKAKDAIVLSGWIAKKGSMVKSWKTRYFVLAQGWLSYYAKGPPHVSDRKGQLP
jgi:hypothetical protein